MRITLDGRSVETPLESGESLQTLIDRVRAAELAERLVVTVTVNGRTLVDQQLTDALRVCVEPGDLVELTSGDRWSLCSDALRGIAEELGDCGTTQPEIAAQLNGRDAQAALHRVGENVALWQSARQSIVDACALLELDLVSHKVADQTVAQRLDSLVDRLSELRDTLQAGDMVALGDMLKYEWPGVYQDWQQVFQHLAEVVAAAATHPQSKA